MRQQAVRLKYICKLGYGEALSPEEGLPADVEAYGSNGPYSYMTRANTNAPAIVIGRKGSYGKINWCPTTCFATDTTFYVDNTLTVQNLRWLYWALQTLRLDAGSQETAIPGINREAIYEHQVPLPDRYGQELIAHYLDKETREIDALIVEKERMLALLEEKRAALVSQAVTRGLDPKAPLKPSGLDWLGDIPAHWAVERSKRLFTVRDERSEKGNEELLTISHITGVTRRSEKDVYMFEAEDKAGYKRCYKGDFVVNTLWGWMGAMGVSPLDGIVSPDYHVYTPHGALLPEFIEALCRSRPFVAEVNRWSKGVWSSRLRLYPEAFFEMRLPVPPIEEQRSIVGALAEESKRSDALAKALRESIELLKERRAALITAAVSGQIEPEALAA